MIGGMIMTKHKTNLICTICNSTDLSYKVWVDKNFEMENDSIWWDTDVWCETCGELKYSDLKEVENV